MVRFCKIRDMKKGDRVRNVLKGVDCMIEKIDAEYVVLDETFGLSTRSDSLHVEWINNHGWDGRYSVNINELSKTIIKL